MPRFSVLDARKNKNHPVQKLKNNADQLRSVQNKNVEADSADELVPDLGNITEGNFVSLANDATSNSPTDTKFSGSFMVGRGVTFPEGDITIGGAENGELNWGSDENGNLIVNSITLNGTALDAGVTRDEAGWITQQTVTVGSEVRVMRMGMESNGTEAEGVIEYNQPGSSVTIPNGDFAALTMSDWTQTSGTWSAEAGWAAGYGNNPEITNAARFAVTAGNVYNFHINTAASFIDPGGAPETATVTIQVKFYTAITGGSLVSTETVGTRTGISLGWAAIEKNITVPATATHAVFIAKTGFVSGQATLQLDDFTVVESTTSRLTMRDGGLFYTPMGGTEFEIEKPLEYLIPKTANESFGNTTETNVTDMLFTVAANTIYWFNLTVKITTATAGGTMDARLLFTLPSGAAIAWGALAGTVSDMEVVNSSTTPNSVSTGTLTIGLDSNKTSIFRFGGFITTSSTAGTVQLKARQNTSNANTFQIDKASFIKYTDLSGANLASPAYYSDAEAQDAVGSLLTDTATINLTYTANTSITADVIDGSITEAKMEMATAASTSKFIGWTGAALDWIAVQASHISDFASTVRATVLTGLSTASNIAIADTDTVLDAAGKLQAQITGYTNGSNTIQVKDNAFSITDEADVTKIANFAIGSQATGTTVVVTVPAFSGVMTTNAGIQTLTNKRITKRTVSVASTATPTPDVSSYDQYQLTALATNATVGAPTGTPTQGEWLIICIKDNGTARTLAWNAVFRGIGLTLPTTTVINKTMYVFAIYNATDVKWDVWKVAQE